ncbi:MAG: hypothetical protein A3J10_03115 [Candidatus Sungbacteria bacterium RIFCSPLOWO2_02_FULL_54_10]|uniref:Uncharacterized protein n=2 Tax=Candidatus Sungiibacteriota TaxID=1817917 RepID=A0A1G2L6B7_9BACT|nr:MAG: hypothetical protein A2679_01390 [Candidatus Sungbacteria bacterium RIFCSPHIGHO2_01_FULL_54_26]OHA03256.1 MAG: hypothetical protein A3C92_03225 [Candidatus Sungbacteria bacterium RIFCSPHIGHO2_02_FULL_53_17]OHA07074.1 MAG: hypothetical protein A3B34_01890 [Candidatus Sungbacteria bacterium RIFCSPLOWO2_01_FULL_54_21]OHA12119.1 MAG: hypothetical protein A3J10_03115 [Candidatus Sungbacteria bacterium RIFCSPLOWO2_02_FULL_54_10]
MFENRAPIVIALLLLFVLVSTSAGFANISGVQDTLRSMQLKLIREKVKLLQQGIIDAGKQQIREREDAQKQAGASLLVKAEPNRRELEAALARQIATLQGVVNSLRPRAIDEETARIEKRIGEIKGNVKTASGIALRNLQDELNGLLAEYDALQNEVRAALTESITYRQALVIQEQIRAVQAKVQVLPVAKAAEIAPAKSNAATDATLKGIEDQVEKLRLKIIQAQIKAIQEKINTLK